MEIIIINSPNKVVTQKIKDFLEPLKVPFELKSESKKDEVYDPEFVKMVLKRSANAKKGKVTEINPKDVWGSIGLK
ncbi:MAG: hypothetical protein COZ75_09090 [Flavobacteriaceae bacterium CG_4_8_14_3_um_filter_34_10]|nr:hypothetical protein [Flavobacteriia bacterium]OIP51627.1 MAG: hypothetical protein AUK33_03965 [Flavobacteriaceae bacterium CG2_30_34_30]PIQ18925.1 MAG: hypothetical protein COW66_03830 [Flavobacteriaceae bacterium CG18_big_fil_WC_8_21_14_2_50_34_36]PIV50098.1 MAG: hypothetical protein COS19_05455 [Flavobacteriaceae bacterium CG02_land_8_20_14_3_00_34_13]PIX08996.1 MAG: hypothetical protein COZ75_09090 [Flavobacteriaceae bacterium CG_4_8_14_3_um_filter_34_10]PIZ06896.1 MAG: hypothetical pr